MTRTTTTPPLSTTATLFFLLLCSPTLALAPGDSDAWYFPRHGFWTRSSAPQRNVPPEGFYDPRKDGGSFLTQVANTFPPGQGEPINVIISGHSDPSVLVDQETGGGLRNYFLSIGLAGECLGQHSGSDQGANLGDGNGYLNETAVIRWDYGDPQLGTCKETIEGGDHLRFWIQNGPDGNSGAIFLALSYELPIALDHDIIPNGYNLGRDWFIGNITGSTIPSANLTNTTTYTGSTSFGGYTYHTDIAYVGGYLDNSSIGINHNLSVEVPGINAVDGLTAILNVSITAQPPKSGAGLLEVAPWRVLTSLVLVTLLSLLS